MHVRLKVQSVLLSSVNNQIKKVVENLGVMSGFSFAFFLPVFMLTEEQLYCYNRDIMNDH